MFVNMRCRVYSLYNFAQRRGALSCFKKCDLGPAIFIGSGQTQRGANCERDPTHEFATVEHAVVSARSVWAKAGRDVLFVNTPFFLVVTAVGLGRVFSFSHRGGWGPELRRTPVAFTKD